MGMSKLNEIVAIFKKGQRRNPVAIIQNGTSREKIGLGTINSIEQVVLNKN
jgi:siroheme synthase